MESVGGRVGMQTRDTYRAGAYIAQILYTDARICGYIIYVYAIVRK